MSNHHGSQIRLGSNAVVNSIWFDKEEHESDSSIHPEFQAVVGSYSDRTFITTKLRLSIPQARELYTALGLALIEQSLLKVDDYKSIQREAILSEMEVSA